MKKNKNNKNKEEVLFEHHLRSVSQAIESPFSDFSSSSFSPPPPPCRKRIGSEMERAKFARIRGKSRHESSLTQGRRTTTARRSARCSSAKRQKREEISDGIYLLGVEFGGRFGGAFGAGFGGGRVW